MVNANRETPRTLRVGGDMLNGAVGRRKNLRAQSELHVKARMTVGCVRAAVNPERPDAVGVRAVLARTNWQIDFKARRWCWCRRW